MANNNNVNLQVPKRKMSYASLIVSLSSVILMIINGIILTKTESFGSFNFYLKNIYLFFGYMIYSQRFTTSRTILFVLYILFTVLPLAALVVALITSRKRKKLWMLPISIIVSLLIFGFYVYDILSLLPG